MLKSRIIYLLGLLLASTIAYAQQLQLYTTYPKISVSPGEVIDYTVELINRSSTTRNGQIRVQNLPKDWDYEIKSGNYNTTEISVLPKERKSLNLKIIVPSKIEKGQYRFQLVAQGESTLPLTVDVTADGKSSSEFNSTQTNMEGSAKSTFTYNASLLNRSSKAQVYSLAANLQPGWGATFKVDGKQVSSVNIEGNQRKDILIELLPPESVKKGTYTIPVFAKSALNQSELALEVVITGSYSIQLSTPEGLLSTTATANRNKSISLVVKNTGSSDLSQINLNASSPTQWEAHFEPSRIASLRAGESQTVTAIIKPAKKAIAGDYQLTFDAKTSETSDSVKFRVTVETSLLWGWVGVLIIALAVGLVYVLIRKYGRR
ncbi:NEW3 domain-containing protein [Sphingobacterium sp. FBM7-1]|uniref:COG1470 family protein n=1 Tax=Sphingobacterium sp. FBM7-1 TaxID=2886688 RepID=UPI001D115E8C|nr:NEW3 domain-containing protein [Sphingobacterium sp. FBM7-1]MCC2598012.1 NEW3 domain-containing protein [Sphingobacterium sp. FBM7-1]